MEYFGGLSDFMMSPIRDVVVGTPPDSLLTLVSQDLPDDIFQDDEVSPVDAIDAVMDTNAGEINLASVSPVSASSLEGGSPPLSDMMDDDSETDDISYVSDEASAAASPAVPADFEDEGASDVAAVTGAFFTDHLDVKEVVVGDVDDCLASDVVSTETTNVILPPTDYVSSLLDDSSNTETDNSTVFVKQEFSNSHKVRHTSSDSYDSYSSTSTIEASPPPALPGSMSLDDLEEEEENESPPAAPPAVDRRESSVKRPRMSYAQLIAEALLNSADRRLTLNDIYVHINARHPYYSLKGGKGWQNAVRHNLTLNKSFVKVPRPANEGRGSWWELEAGAEKGIFKRLLRQHYMYKVALDTKQQSYGVSSSSSMTNTTTTTTSQSKLPEAAVVRTASPPAAVKASQAAVRAAPVKTVKRAQPAPPKPQIKIIKSIPLVNPKVGAAVTSSSSSKPTIIYVTLPRHLFK